MLQRVSKLAAIVVTFAVGTTVVGAEAGSPKLAGRWQRLTTCAEIVSALRQAGLGPTAPAVIADNGFVPGTPKQLSRKANICSGALPRRHSHFFTAAGQFGSIDFGGKQVDDGSYRLVNPNTVRINDGSFRFRIAARGLSLTPVISAALKRRALAHPLRFSTAAWMVAVALPPGSWKRVACAGWC